MSDAVVPTLAERLGYTPDDVVVILNCDDLGSSHAANEAVYDCIRHGVAGSATLMVPCPWARDAADRYDGEDVGVHLTLTSEWANYRWAPVTGGPTLRAADGRFPRTNDEVWAQADLGEVRDELEAQIQLALDWGFDVTHLDSHMGTLQLEPRFFEIYLDLAVAHDLPLRLSGRRSEGAIGFAFRDRAADAGVVAPDHLVVTAAVDEAIGKLRPGVTEFYLHPATDRPDLRALAPDWETRLADTERLSAGGSFAGRLREAGAEVISYRPLRDLQRSARARSVTE